MSGYGLMLFRVIFKHMKYYYLYLIKFETGEVYVGSRSSKVRPEDDVNYWGSPVTYEHWWKDSNRKKKKYVIKECSDPKELREIEPKLIKAAWEKYGDKCLNRNAAPVFHPEVCSKNGKRAKELGLGIHGLSKEERIRNGKLGAKKIAEKYSRIFTIKSPNGNIITTKNLSKFCRENNLDIRHVSHVLKQERKSHKGWTLP